LKEKHRGDISTKFYETPWPNPWSTRPRTWTGTPSGSEACYPVASATSACPSGLHSTFMFWSYAHINCRPLLLHAKPNHIPIDTTPARNDPPPRSDSDDEDKPHRDEYQIHLDTERSFVFYPVGEPYLLLLTFIALFR
jgi:hypothetical protein